jgi:2,3-bisphosphoglycerate-dependent phosphoglycerate mutase
VPICLLVRHGHSTANAEGVLAGRLDGVLLTDTGRRQVDALAVRFSGLSLARVVTSPLERCRETAEAVAVAMSPSLEVHVDEGLWECGYGAWTGRPIKELVDEPLWRVVQDQPSAARFPAHETYAAESLLEMRHRAVATVRRHDAEVAAEHGPHALWAAVTHGDVIKAVLADAAGSHFDHLQRFRADPASVSVVHYTDRRPFLVGANDMGSDLARLVPPVQPEVPEGDAPVGGGSADAEPSR